MYVNWHILCLCLNHSRPDHLNITFLQHLSQKWLLYWKRIVKEAYVDSILLDIVPISILDIQSSPSIPVQPDSSSHELNKLHDLREPDPAHASVPEDIIVSIGDIRVEFGANTSDNTILSLIKAACYALGCLTIILQRQCL